jgi:hypothetical protein
MHVVVRSILDIRNLGSNMGYDLICIEGTTPQDFDKVGVNGRIRLGLNMTLVNMTFVTQLM